MAGETIRIKSEIMPCDPPNVQGVIFALNEEDGFWYGETTDAAVAEQICGLDWMSVVGTEKKKGKKSE